MWHLLLLEVVNLIQLSFEHAGEFALILVIPVVGGGACLDGDGSKRTNRQMKLPKP